MVESARCYYDVNYQCTDRTTGKVIKGKLSALGIGQDLRSFSGFCSTPKNLREKIDKEARAWLGGNPQTRGKDCVITERKASLVKKKLLRVV